MSGAAVYAHLHPEVQTIADSDDTSRETWIGAERWIEYPAALGVLQIFQELFEQLRRDRMKNALLLGASGMGKSTLVRKFERINAAPYDGTHLLRKRPVLVVLMPPDPTPEDLFDGILKALGAPMTGEGRGREARKQEVATALLHEAGTRVLVLDEINSLLVGTARQQRLFLQMLRFLSNELRISLICTGTLDAKHALWTDTQLRSRFSEITLPLWQPDADMQSFVNRIVSSLPLRRPSPIDSPKIRRLLTDRSGGVTLYVCEALQKAAVTAIHNGTEMIDFAALENDAVWRGRPPLVASSPPPAAGVGRASGLRP